MKLLVSWWLFIQMCDTCQPVLLPGGPFRDKDGCEDAYQYLQEEQHAMQGSCIPRLERPRAKPNPR